MAHRFVLGGFNACEKCGHEKDDRMPICDHGYSTPCYACPPVHLDGKVEMDISGISDDVTLRVDTPDGTVLLLPLAYAACIALANDGIVLPFVYQIPPSEEDEEPSRHRKAKLMIVDEGYVT